jgi:outer membrane protein assembly factor BamE (lipoprotein component of BamABCDE complex)
VCGVSCYVAYYALEEEKLDEKYYWTIIFFGIAFIFNPIFQLRLGKSLWSIVDIITSIIMIVSIFKVRDRRTPPSLYPKIVAGFISIVILVAALATIGVIQYQRTKGKEIKQPNLGNFEKNIIPSPKLSQEQPFKITKQPLQQKTFIPLKETDKGLHEKEVKGNYFTIGSTKDEVLAIQGTPTSISNNVWHYSYSRVSFSGGKVIGFNNISNNLKIQIASKSSKLEYFTIGSTKDEVLAVQGTPTSISNNVWYYSYSRVSFSGGKVIGFNNISNNLKIQIANKYRQ